MLRRSQINRTGLKRGTVPLRAKRKCLWVGRKTRANMKANAFLKRKFDAMGIRSCELGYENCTVDDYLSWAHGRKRRKLQGDELTTLVCLACCNCHSRIEVMSPEGMLAIVRSVIAERGWQ